MEARQSAVIRKGALLQSKKFCSLRCFMGLIVHVGLRNGGATPAADITFPNQQF